MTSFSAKTLAIGALSLTLALGACKKVETEDDNEIVLTTNDTQDGETRKTVVITKSKDGNSSSSSSSSSTSSSNGDESVSMSFNSDGFNLDIDVPINEWTTDAKADGSSDGLYPGSQVTNVSVNTNTVDGETIGNVRIDYSAPADPDTVAKWTMNHITKKGGTAKRKGNVITATDKDGDNFTITLKPDGKGTKGRMVMNNNG
ncbi:hypothetical protein ACR9YC_09475 [Parasphingorhabdus sp. DH2-15]|uniref:hypothetical protein n=1 Tax=Parasphingorhabdus sp. DH2-15 TaxID=3444112 RepID=UPI003F685CDF